MSEEDLEIVRRAYEAYAKGDLATARQAYSEDTVWDVTRFRPDEGIHRGKEDLAGYIRSWRETWAEHSFSLEQALDAGDRVVAVIVESGTGKGSGAPVTIRYGQVIKVSGGKIAETIVYRDVDEALEVAGLLDPGGEGSHVVARSLKPEAAWGAVQLGFAEILDLRTGIERRRHGAPPGARQVPLAKHIVSPEGPGSIYLCQRAIRSKATLRRGAAEVAGGFAAWKEAGLPVEDVD
jgi:ketosteroid isomerase-like protein/rhodanese-related sulfurtransferase